MALIWCLTGSDTSEFPCHYFPHAHIICSFDAFNVRLSWESLWQGRESQEVRKKRGSLYLEQHLLSRPESFRTKIGNAAMSHCLLFHSLPWRKKKSIDIVYKPWHRPTGICILNSHLGGHSFKSAPTPPPLPPPPPHHTHTIAFSRQVGWLTETLRYSWSRRLNENRHLNEPINHLLQLSDWVLRAKLSVKSSVRVSIHVLGSFERLVSIKANRVVFAFLFPPPPSPPHTHTHTPSPFYLWQFQDFVLVVL